MSNCPDYRRYCSASIRLLLCQRANSKRHLNVNLTASSSHTSQVLKRRQNPRDHLCGFAFLVDCSSALQRYLLMSVNLAYEKLPTRDAAPQKDVVILKKVLQYFALSAALNGETRSQCNIVATKITLLRNVLLRCEYSYANDNSL